MKSSEHVKICQRRLSKYLSAILWANQGSVAPNLKTLIFADSAPTIGDQIDWEQSTNTSKERLEGYVQIFEMLHIVVGQVVVEINQEALPGTDDEDDIMLVSSLI